MGSIQLLTLFNIFIVEQPVIITAVNYLRIVNINCDGESLNMRIMCGVGHWRNKKLFYQRFYFSGLKIITDFEI